jgi:hypothetical protein
MSKDLEIYESSNAQGTQVQSAFTGGIQQFEHAQRVAKALSTSTLVPSDYRNNIPNTMIALEMAQRVNASPMAVMQNLYIIHGRPSWSSQFTIAALNGCGRFSSIRFSVRGEGDSKECYAWAVAKEDGEKLVGPVVSIKMAKAEGWFSKKGSKWQTMPDLMLRYRAAKFFGNLYAPDIMMGMTTEDESRDIRRQPRQEKEVEITQGFTPAEPVQEVKEPEPVQAEPISIEEIDEF